MDNGQKQPFIFGKGYQQDFFIYGPPAPVVLDDTNPTATSIIQIDAEAAFEWIATTYFAMVAGDSFDLSPAATADAPTAWPIMSANNLLPPVLLQIVDTGSGKYLMNTPVPLPAMAGDGREPYRLIAPREFMPNSAIQLNWTYVGPADRTYTIYPQMHGFKKYVRLG